MKRSTSQRRHPRQHRTRLSASINSCFWQGLPELITQYAAQLLSAWHCATRRAQLLFKAIVTSGLSVTPMSMGFWQPVSIPGCYLQSPAHFMPSRKGTASERQAALRAILHWAMACEAAAEASSAEAQGPLPQPSQRLAQTSVQPSLAAAAVAALPLAISPAKHEAHAIVVTPAAAAAEGGFQEGPTNQQIPAVYPSLPAGVVASRMWQQPMSGSLPTAECQTLGLGASAKACGSTVAGSPDMAAAVCGAACWSQADCDIQAAVWGMLHTLQCAPGSCHALAAEALCRWVGCPGFGRVVNACVGHAVQLQWEHLIPQAVEAVQVACKDSSTPQKGVA